MKRNYDLLGSALSGRNFTAEQIDTRATGASFRRLCALAPARRPGKGLAEAGREVSEAEMERLAEAVFIAADPDVDAAFEESETYRLWLADTRLPVVPVDDPFLDVDAEPPQE